MDIDFKPYIMLNYNCMKMSNDLIVLSTDSDNKLVLSTFDHTSKNMDWIFYPNLLKGSVTGGYTLYNSNKGDSLAAKQPSSTGDQITLEKFVADDESFCWTLWPVGENLQSQQLWAVQSNQRTNAMDAYNKECSVGTEVIFYRWKIVGNTNQQWYIVHDDFREKGSPHPSSQIIEYCKELKDKVYNGGG